MAEITRLKSVAIMNLLVHCIEFVLFGTCQMYRGLERDRCQILPLIHLGVRLGVFTVVNPSYLTLLLFVYLFFFLIHT